MDARKEPMIITDKENMRNWSRAIRSQGKTIALVPTMGYLHQGHLSLVKEARSLANLIVVSIYVNPGQFSPSEDLSTYPSDFHGDILKLMSVPGGVDVVFHPHNLYDYYKIDDDKNKNGNSNFRASGEKCKDLEGEKVVSCVEDKGMGHETWVRVERLEKGMCGKSRPVFFRGVATIVTKLLNIVEPDFAMFGKKDYQQWRIIQRMVRDLDFSIRIVGSEIMRDSDGLALSSRNVHLSAEDREKALSISRSLLEAKSCAEKGQINCRELRDLVIQAINGAGGKIDYAEVMLRT
ncbi:pantoate--beta-alanine ligase isoform X2 [Ricinus communis]|uniref:pantoate--beta-alanine ligase isoform X2 n=1 Tax=Ricinus communis TaxID=3988 RepID=UPI000772D156|nr:pantoate--beta-alanine ligase isoform X2 [Ricinus communis]|eukprot:XP_015575965.1 pantoate--beta-alanine ligase isoform X2 [Ricinus communis]